jgi:hypothetical protein
MPGPIVFISHLRIKEGKLEDYRRAFAEQVPVIEAEKPRTEALLSYLHESGDMLTNVHIFADADGFDLHLQGVGDRFGSVAELIEPAGYEIFGEPSEAALKSMRAFAEGGGVELKVEPDNFGGFLRLVDG